MPSDTQCTLSRCSSRRARRRKRAAAWITGVALLLAVAAVWNQTTTSKVVYLTENVAIGPLAVTVTATGNLKPRHQVEIGSELSGTVRAVMVEVNDRVVQGQLLAVLDTARLEAELLQAQSAVAAADALLMQTDASLWAAGANHARLHRVRELSGNKLPSRQELDGAEAALARAHGQAAAARASVTQAEAGRDAIRADLSKGEIRAPIGGVVLARSIEPGQTVAASLQAPTLFTLAEDPRQMELHLSVDEADVGSLRIGQLAAFAVDAFPHQSFEARIARIHMASSNTRGAMQSGASMSTRDDEVVTYEAVLDVDNPELRLRPGMTATAAIITSMINDATLVPNAALRFTPILALLPRTDDADRGRRMTVLMPYLREQERWRCPREAGRPLACVWLLERGQPVLAMFKPGATDRTNTQVLKLERLPAWRGPSLGRDDPILVSAIARQLKPGMQVIVDNVHAPSD